jgi:hypothetical protein
MTYIISRLRLPQANIFRRQPHDVPRLIDDAGPRAARAHVDADVVVHRDVDFVARVDGPLARGRVDAAVGAGGTERESAGVGHVWVRVMGTGRKTRKKEEKRIKENMR